MQICARSSDRDGIVYERSKGKGRGGRLKAVGMGCRVTMPVRYGGRGSDVEKTDTFRPQDKRGDANPTKA